jgi:hypothetical protein
MFSHQLTSLSSHREGCFEFAQFITSTNCAMTSKQKSSTSMTHPLHGEMSSLSSFPPSLHTSTEELIQATVLSSEHKVLDVEHLESLMKKTQKIISTKTKISKSHDERDKYEMENVSVDLPGGDNVFGDAQQNVIDTIGRDEEDLLAPGEV